MDSNEASATKAKNQFIKIKGVDLTPDAEFYFGKKVAFITTRAKVADKFGNKFRVTWGKVCRARGSNGVVRCDLLGICHRGLGRTRSEIQTIEKLQTWQNTKYQRTRTQR